MANTKKMDRKTRVKNKTEQRRKNKSLYAGLTKAQIRKWRSYEGGGFKHFLASLDKEKASGEAKPAEAKPAEAKPAESK